MNNFLDFGWHNVNATTDINDSRFIDEYIKAHYDEIFKTYCECEYDSIVGCKDWDSLADLVGVDEEEYYGHGEDLLNDFNKEYIMQKIEEGVKYDTLENRIWEDDYWREYVREDFYQELDKEHEYCVETVKSAIEKRIAKAPEGLKLKCLQEKSHSWNTGRFSSVYFTVSVGDESFTIRVCDGHSNGRSSDYQINFHWFDEDDFNEDLDILFDNLIENFKSVL